MILHTKINDEKRITATSEKFNLGEGDFLFDFPNSFNFAEQSDYKIVDGILVHDPIINNEESEPTQLDIIEAQVTYTAMMTDTLLEV